MQNSRNRILGGLGSSDDGDGWDVIDDDGDDGDDVMVACDNNNIDL